MFLSVRISKKVQILAVCAVFLMTAVLLPQPASAVGPAPAEAEKLPGKSVYLTFDDGPSENTQHLLEVLEKHQVSATFFLIGSKEEEWPLIRQMVKQNCAVAPHAWNHDYQKIYASKQAFFQDFNKISQQIQKITGSSVILYRFPGGSVNRYIPPDTLRDIHQELEQRSITYVDWNIVSGDDTQVVYPPQTLTNNVLEKLKDCENTGTDPVILFHDASLCSTTADAVDLLIPVLKRRGYTFAVLTPETTAPQFYRNRAKAS